MDDFELRLKRIPLAQPPGDMKARIFGSEPSGRRIMAYFGRRIPLSWAAVLALLTGLAGIWLSQWLRGPMPLPSKVVSVQIIKAPSERNLFDFTEPAADFLPGELTVKVKPPEEI